MPLAFEFEPLGKVVVGPGTLARLGDLTAPFGRRALLVTDPGLAQTGHPHRAESFLREAGLTVCTFDRVKENPTEQQVWDGVRFAQDHRIDVIIAIGGGSSMD
ncbi:MAG: iron-containing alcohol dehydrogenase, partial [Gemmataceae bacterium]